MDFGCAKLSGNNTAAYCEANVVIRPYKRTGVVWFTVKRTLTTQNLKLGVDYKNTSLNWARFTAVLPNASNHYTKKWAKGEPYYTYGGSNNTHLCAYDLWADTPDVSPLSVEANVFLL